MMKSSTACPTSLLARFLEGKLNEEQAKSVEKHLETCDSCCQTLELQAIEHNYWAQLSALSDDELDLDWNLFSSGANIDFEQAVPAEDGMKQPGIPAAFEAIENLLSPSDDPIAKGRIGSYEVLGIIGSGGMGIVLKVRDPALDRIVALKILAPQLSVLESSRIRFQREARASAAVKHDGIVPIFGVDSHRGTPYFVMPYEKGPSLQQRINQDGKLSVEEALRVAMQIADALSAAHQSGLVHRDIKPSNILLAPGTERALLTDFGLAQVEAGQQITQSGLLTGTPAFMSPEQARGEAVDSRSDLFSLGSVLFMMLTGQAPVEEETTYAVVRRIGGEAMPSVRDVDPAIPDWMDQLVSLLHASDASSRIQSAAETKVLLSQCLAVVQNPLENSIPVRLSQPQLRSSILKSKPIILSVGLSFAIVIASIGYMTQFAWPRSTTQSADGTEETSPLDPLAWDDGLDTPFAEISERLDEFEQEQSWIINSAQVNDK